MKPDESRSEMSQRAAALAAQVRKSQGLAAPAASAGGGGGGVGGGAE
jgi:hypothetical protein